MKASGLNIFYTFKVHNETIQLYSPTLRVKEN